MKTSQTTEAVTAEHRFCTSCGHATTGRFCARCGTEVARSLVTAEPAAADQPTVALDRPTKPADPDLLDTETWQEEVDEDPEPARTGIARRRPVLAAAAVLVVAALVAGGVMGSRYLADGDVRAALAASSGEFNGVVEALTEASSIDAVASAAQKSDAAARRVEDALRGLGAVRGPEDSSVRTQLEAERAVLSATAQLAGVAGEPLDTWGAAHDDLTAALAAESTSRATLQRFHEDAARELADTALMLTKVTTAVGPALVDDATADSTRLLEGLAAAKSTADLRKLGDAAAPEQAAVAAAAKALPTGKGEQVLTGYASALGALSELSEISGDSTGTWNATRADLAQTFGQVAAGAGSTGGAEVRVVLDRALDAADGVVSAAAAAIADWKAKTEAAIKARSTDTEALTSYAGFFRSQVKTYEQLREDLSTFTDRVEDPGVYYYEAYAFMSQAEQDRRNVRDYLVSTDVPAGVGDAHQGVVSAIDRAIGAVRSAYDGLSQSQDCYEGCPYYQDTPGWQRFLSESDGISKAYASAMSRWETSVAAAKLAITNRALPAKPAV